MNCYFVSCEIAENPDLQGKIVAVGSTSTSRKSIILSASYEARKYGVRAAMRISDAYRLCPNLILVDPNGGLYQEYSRKFFDYFYSITPLVEPASIDEGFLDITDVCKPEEVIDLAHKMQKYLLDNLHLPCSIGIAPNKFLAKMASDMKKPLGITVLRKREIEEKLWPLPIGDMLGVGHKTRAQLELIGIKTIGDLAKFKDLELLRNAIGEHNAEGLISHANGYGSNEIETGKINEVSSISNSQTFEQDEYNVDEILLMIKLLVNSVVNRLEKHHKKAYTFTLQIKYNTFMVVSRSKSVDKPINDNHIIYKLLKDLFEDYYDSNYGVRLIGVASSRLVDVKDEPKQISIFDDLDEIEKNQKINKLIHEINQNIGSNALIKGIKANEDKK